MIYIQRDEVPQVLNLEDSMSLGAKEYADAINHFTNNSRNFNFEAYKEVKDILENMFNSKCAYCESEIAPVSFGDIEHFRPKSAIKKNSGESLHYPGYYWLAMDWNNLLLACEVCNRRHKKNYFPLVDESNRKRKHDDDIIEEPLLIDPCDETLNPQNYINFKENGLVSYYLNDGGKGENSIKIYGLDRPELTRERKKLALEINDKKSCINRLLENIDVLLQQPSNDGNKIILKNTFTDLEKIHESLKKYNVPTEPYQALVKKLTNDFLVEKSPLIEALLSEYREIKVQE